jgi:hypothetical protein
VDESERESGGQRQPLRHRRRHLGCLALTLLVIAAIIAFVWIDSEQLGTADPNIAGPMQGPVEAVPARRPQ